jgi:DNA (cytosine-5)-methyltransferase 1
LSSPVVDGPDWLPFKEVAQVSPYARRLRQIPNRGLGTDQARAQLAEGFTNGFQFTKHSQEVAERFDRLEEGQRDPISKYARLAWDKPAQVLRAGTGNDKGSFQAARPIHPTEPRVITVREAARIQGFPDWFQFHTTKWHSHRMIGNSVSPIFAAAILRVILSRLAVKEKLEAAE